VTTFGKYDQCAMDLAALDDMIDRVVDGRYRIDAPIGASAIAAVFVAYDTILERSVALKIFADDVADDEAFSSRLLQVVEHAATLKHPNIVELYDWGFDGAPYITSELCLGGSVASLLAAGERLSASQALVMALECARGLQHGHANDFVHRNLKPTNVLFGADQRVRIADYGLAQVMADAPIEHVDQALESVRYSSPEQARGRPITSATDMYSLALVVNQAVSGDAPATAETVVGTLMERAEAAAALSPRLEGLGGPLERCGRINADERPEAEELTIAFLASAETMPRPAPFPLARIRRPDHGVNPLDAQTNVADIGPSLTESRAAQKADGEISDSSDLLDDFDGSSFDGRTIEDPAVDEDPLGTVVAMPKPVPPVGLENLAEAEPVFASVPGDEIQDSPFDVPERSGAPRAARIVYEEIVDDADEVLPVWPLALLGAILVGVVALVAYFLAFAGGVDSAEVPNVVGLAYEDLEAQVANNGWQIETLEDREDGSAAGSIISQDPAAGTKLANGEILSVTVSLGGEMVEIPSDIVGLSVDQAASRLASVGLAVGPLVEENNESLGPGLVIGLDEPTSQKAVGEGVALRVSLGAQDRVVPDTIIGVPIADATTVLTSLRLQAVEEPAYSPDAEAGTVLGSNPRPGEVVPADSAVTLVVSAGPEPVIMPDIIGLPLDEAIDVIEALGLIFVDTEGTPGEDAIGSLPPIGAMADVGSEVTIILDDPSEDEDDDS